MSIRVAGWRSLEARVSLLVLALFLLGAAAISWAISQLLQADTQRMLGEQQRATVAILAQDINRELDDRFEVLSELATLLAPVLATRPAQLQQVLQHHMPYHTLFDAGAFVTDVNGTALASLPVSIGRLGQNFMDRDFVASALREGKAVVGRPVMGRNFLTPIVVMAVPVRDGRGRVIGAVMGVSRLQDSNYLDAITQSHYGISGGYVLVARQHRLIVTASDRSRIMLPLPEVGRIPALDLLVDGDPHTYRMPNKDGVEVLASAAPIPTADWVLIATIPTAEAFAPIHDRQPDVLLASILLAAASALLTWWALKHFLSPLFAASRALDRSTRTGELPPALDIVRRDEVGQLMHAVNHTLEALAQRETQLRESQALLRSITDSVDAAMVVTDAAGTILALNQPWLRLAQEQPSPLPPTAQAVAIGSNYLAALSESQRARPQAQLAQALAGMEAVRQGQQARFSMEFPCTPADPQRWLQLVVTALDGASGGLVISYTDSTERKQVANELLEARRMADKANQAKSVFLAAASHDLRQPLAALTLYVDVLEARADADSRALVARIQDCSRGLGELLGNLLEMSKLEAGVVVPAVSDFSVDRFCANLVSMHAASAMAKGLRLRYRPCAGHGHTDAALLRRIVGNLLTNAIAYTASGGVLLACRRRAGVSWLEVWDTGIGIEAGQHRFIFEEFTRLRQPVGDVQRTEGSGLGLSIVARTAALLGLQIRMRSEPGRGSVFAVELPPGQAPQGGDRILSPARRTRQALCIALVEDSAQVRHALRLVLENEGHEVFCAANTAELLECLGARRPDMVISDYRLGAGETGFHVVHAARAAWGKQLAALLITGDTDPDLIQHLTRQGIAIQYKPLKMQALLAFVNQSAQALSTARMASPHEAPGDPGGPPPQQPAY